jgi:CO/xanthine dehydrogenase FAD-binding subunit
VVDLQKLGFGEITARGNTVHIGATASLEALLHTASIQPALAAAIRHEAAYNLRQTATVAGSLVAAGGRSPFALAMLALDAQLHIQPGGQELAYGELLALGANSLRGKLITKIALSTQATLKYEYVARTPADLPIVALALASWPSGRTRLAVGGWGDAPILALDGREGSGLAEGIENAFSSAGDQWASAEYRIESGKALLARMTQA